MGGDHDSALKSAETQRKKYGADHFAVIGAAGGHKSKGKPRSEETKRKISETIKRKKREARENAANVKPGVL